MPHVHMSAEFACLASIRKLTGSVSRQALFGKQSDFLEPCF